MLSVSQRFRDILQKKAHELVGYRERPDGHDFINWRQGLTSGLITLLQRDDATRGEGGEALLLPTD
jgi:hypothetical protein